MTIRISISTENHSAKVKCSNGTEFDIEPNSTGSVAIFDDIKSIEVTEAQIFDVPTDFVQV